MSAELLYLALAAVCYVTLFAASLIGAEALLVLIAIITITGNVIVGKIIVIFGFQMASSACLAVILFWIGSILTQYYGLRPARRALWYNFGSLIFLTVVGWLAIKLPGNITPEMDQATNTIFSFMPSVMLAALFSFGVSYMFAIFVQRRIQKSHGGDLHWCVQTGLVATANLLDITIFATIAYWGIKINLPQVILMTWAMRLIAMILGLPVILLIRKMYTLPRFPLFKPSEKNI